MKIGNPADKPAIAPVDTKPAKAREAAGQTPAASGAAADPSAKVQLSEAARLLAGSDGAEFDAKKVQEVSDAIADGTYKVNAEAIADKLIANAQELLGKVNR